MRSSARTLGASFFFVFLSMALVIQAQAGSRADSGTVVFLRIIDENGIAVPDALVTIRQGQNQGQLRTDYLGRCRVALQPGESYSIRVEKPGHYVFSLNDLDPETEIGPFVLTHQQQIRETIDVVDSPPTIDPEQTSDASRMQTQEIINLPYPTSRDIRNLLPFNPGVVRDPGTAQVHVAGSQTWQTQNLLEGFNVTSPVNGTLSMRFSADAMRGVEVQSTRYPAEYGKASGGITAFRAGMGDDRFRFNATNFIPSFQNKKGLTFDKFVPRFTFSGPIKRGKAWFYDGLELEYSNVIIPELPDGVDSNRPWRGSNLAKAQVNLSPVNILTLGGIVNLFRSPYEGISPLTPQNSTARHDINAGFAFLKDQHTFHDGTVLEAGVAGIVFQEIYAPHGTGAYILTPEGARGSYFENSTGSSSRIQQKVDLYVSPQQWAGRHVLRTGVDINQIRYDQEATRQPVNYLRSDGTLLRQSAFPQAVDFSGNNVEFGAYVQDRYSPSKQWNIEPGVRFDWDSVIRRGLLSPRFAFTYAFGEGETTKLSVGIGLYFDHTQIEFIERARQGPRVDTYFGPDGVTPVSPPIQTTFVHIPGTVRAPRTLNWSVGLEHKLPHQIYLRANFIQKRGTNQFTYESSELGTPQMPVYVLRNSREDKYKAFEISARRDFARGYSLFGSYVRSSARTNQALEYFPGLSVLGPQGAGPLPWDVPNRILSWGWLPLPKTKRVDFVYAVEWHTGYPYTSVTADQQIAGTPNAHRFPDYFSLSPGLEVRFHLRKTHFGLRGVAENITGRRNPLIVNNVVDSPNYQSFLGHQGRAFTARIRIIGSK